MTKRRFHVACDEAIRKGHTTDVYFERAVHILKQASASKRVKAEFSIRRLPHGFPWGVFAGLEECMALLEGVGVRVKALDEGTIIRSSEPVMTVEGDYEDFAVLETPLLGLICQASGIATKAARLRIAAGDRSLTSFGARRMHPAISPMIERSAFIGGCDGVATVGAADLLGIEPSGTIPHALVIICGGIDLALTAFDKFISKKVKRVALVDTFGDEKFEALEACGTLGKALYAIRLDTPASRRGNMSDIVKEVRWELDMRGYSRVKIMVSGGLDELDLMELKQVVDAFGVGTNLSSASVLDYAMDIVEVEGKPVAKRGKASGEKNLLRCGTCHRDLIVPARARETRRCECGGRYKGLMRAWLENGKLVRSLPTAARIRNRVIRSLDWLHL